MRGLSVKENESPFLFRSTTSAANNGEATALTLGNSCELVHALLANSHDVSLLRFTAPDLHGAHASISAVNLTKLKGGTQTGVLNQFWKGVGQSTGTDIVDEFDGVVLSHGHTGIDDLLGSPLNLCVASLHTGKIQVCRSFTRSDTGGSTTAQTNEHSRTTENDEEGTRLHGIWLFNGMLRPDCSDTTSKHDGLMVSSQFRLAISDIDLCKKSTEVSGGTGSSKLVVVGGAANRSLQHDIQTACDVVGLANIKFPRLSCARDQEIRNAVTGKTGLGLRSPPDGTFVTNLTTGTSCCTWRGGDCCGMVVSFDLGQEVNQLLGVVPLPCERVRGPVGSLSTFKHSRIVAVGTDGVVWMSLMCIPDHSKKTVLHLLAINHPRCIELLVATMLRVDLSKHEQFDIGRVTGEGTVGSIGICEVVYFRLFQCQTQPFVGFL